MIVLLPLLYVLAGAAIALFSYTLGRNNQSPIKIPSLRGMFHAADDNGQEPAKPTHSSRGM